MQPEFGDSVVLITGGTGGIGAAVAAALMRRGARVVLAGRTREALDERVQQLRAVHPDVAGFACDVTVKEDVRRLVRDTLALWGRIDVLVTCAGTASRGSVQRLDEADWDRMMTVNAKGAFLCAQAVFPHMKRQRRGWIVNVASYAGKVGIAGSGGYSASKFAVVGLTQALAAEGARFGIRAAAICPAFVNTPMHAARPPIPVERMIQPCDVSGAVLFLLGLSEHATVKEIVIELADGVVAASEEDA